MENIGTLQEIAGEHLPLYEKYYHQCNPNAITLNQPIIKALDAANFLRKSGLNQMTLKIIWDLSDPNGLGYLDKKSFFVALKLVSMVQNGKEPNYQDIKSSLPPPNINDDFFKSIDWNISMENAQKFCTVFNSMNPIDGKLAGSTVKPYLMSSKLPVESLTRIWDLSDIDQDGALNLKEFIVCCQLIAKAKQGYILPVVLPPELSNFKTDILTNRSISRNSSIPSGSPYSNINDFSTIQWIVTNEEKTESDELFVKLDKDNDGFVGGLDVKDTLLESGLPQEILAHIWNLCDMKETGKLNSEQFALARYFIKLKQTGGELPPKLLPQMIPPTLRPKPTESNENINGSLNQSASTTGNKELDVLNEDIKKLQQDKIKFESEVVNEEASLKLKQSEVKSVQNEIEALGQMLKQLENQKNDAKKKIDELQSQVENLNKQYIEQKKGIDGQETDLLSKKKEFEQLKQEEVILETKLTKTKGEFENISELATKTQLQISHIKANQIEIDEYERRFNDISYDYDNAISNADYAKITTLLARSITPPAILNEDLDLTNEQNNDEFKAEFNSDPFAGEDPFKDDPFGSKTSANPEPSTTANAAAAFGSDNFANFDAFSNNKGDPFGFTPFDSQAQSSNFGRSESPTPALPPKKSGKAPPPRPAPPKGSSSVTANKTPLRAAPPPPGGKTSSSASAFDPFNDQRDPFGSGAGGGNSGTDAFGNSANFANFADFDKA